MVDCSAKASRPHAWASSGSLRIVVLTWATTSQPASRPTTKSSNAPTGSVVWVGWVNCTRDRIGDQRSSVRTQNPSATSGAYDELAIGAVVIEGGIGSSPAHSIMQEEYIELMAL